jgi:hypothetical protein
MKLTKRQHRRTDIKYKKRIYKVSPGKSLNPCCEDDIKNVMSWLQEAEAGEVITIEILEMTPEEYDALPEYMGP